MTKRFLAGGVILNTKGEVVVVQQHSGASTSFSLPKGRIEPGEQPLDAARREILEETGLTSVEYNKELGTYQRHPLGKDPRTEVTTVLSTITIFLFTTADDTLSPRDPHNPRAFWMGKHEVAKKLTHNKDKEFFLSIIDQL